MTFPEATMAKRFVRRLHRSIGDVATLRSEERVWVIDAHDPPHTEAILRLARVSAASWAKYSPEAE
jgi:hypothetical protein